MKAHEWTRVVNGGQKFKDASGEGYIYRGKRFYLVKYGPTITGPHFKEPEAQTERGE